MAYSQAANKATQRYQKKTYDQLAIRIPKGKREEYKEIAAQNGESLAGMIARLLDAQTDNIIVSVIPSESERIKTAAQKSGKSLDDYILDAVDKQIAIDEDGENIPSFVFSSSIEWLQNHGHTSEEITDFLKALGDAPPV